MSSRQRNKERNALRGLPIALGQASLPGFSAGPVFFPTPLSSVVSVTGTLPIHSSGGATPDISSDTFTGDTGTGGFQGDVPPPAAGDSAAGKFLAAGGGWAVPAATISIPGPYADDTAAAGAGVIIGNPYYLASGFVVIRLV